MGTSAFRESSFEDQVSSFKTLEGFFKDLEQRFQGNDLILKKQTIAMNKTIDARLCSRKPALKVCKYAFLLCIFEIRLTYKNFNLRPVILSLSAKIIRKCMSIDISLPHGTVSHTQDRAMQIFFPRQIKFPTQQRVSFLRQEGSKHTQIGQFLTRDLAINYAKTKIVLSRRSMTNSVNSIFKHT